MSALRETVMLRQAASDEDVARADVYGVLALLYREPPADAFLASLAAQADAPADTPLQQAWMELARRARALPPEMVRAEHDALFGGVGRPQVFPNGSWHLSGFLHERPLADLREHLARLGLAPRLEGCTEDHLSVLCETLRHMILSGDPQLMRIDAQKDFFHAHLGSWADRFAEAVGACPEADFHRASAQFLKTFLDVERQAFDIE